MEEETNTQEHLKKLILEAKSGNQEAFEEIYKDYYTPLFRYIRARTKRTEEAEDITQTVFMKIWQSLPKWNTKHSSPRAFFFTVARNSIIDYFRKQVNKEIASDEIVRMTADSEGREEENDTRDTRGMHQALSKLSQEQRDLVTLIYTNDLTYTEIAEITGKREDALRKAHSRIVQKLREIYDENTTYTL